jgi:agmatine deiminase
MSIRWPAEWEPHVGIWVAWPHNIEDWPDRFGPIPWVFGDFLSKLSRVEHVNIIAQKITRPAALDILERLGVSHDRFTLYDYPTDRVWTRDFCPIWVQGNTKPVAIKFQFNAWAKYDNWEHDDATGQQVAGDQLHLPQRGGRRIVLEGGGLEGNGQGTLLTTREWLLSDLQVRNPGYTQADYEAVFAEFLGITKTIWLNKGIVGDDTHGHIDDLARFVNPTTVVCVYESDPGDANHEALRENVEILRASTTARGERLNVITLPMPEPILFDEQRLPASYANFLIANDAVFVPVFNDPADRHALHTLAHCFPEREIVPIYCGDLVWGLGTLHCMTMQQPSPS